MATDTLIDTSAWVGYFRRDRAADVRVRAVVEDARAAVTGPVFAELVSGATNLPLFQRMSGLLEGLAWIPTPPDAWERVAELRFSLARQGIQTNLLDLLIAVTSSQSGHRILTRDRDFLAIARVLPIDVECF